MSAHKFLLFFVFAGFSSFSAFSQFRVSGQTIDEEGLGVPFSNVAILSPADSSIIRGAASDFDGNFSLVVPAGSYLLRLSYIGYKTQVLNEIIVSADLDLGQVRLETDVQKMDEVVIESTKYDIEVRPGVKAYNVGDSPAAESSNALDMLSNIPSASVGFDDEVSFRGRKVAVFIDGVESDVANILEQIPATEIESIEVISTPSAKWDIKNGESIINVVLKKNNRSGISGNTALTVGNDDHQKINMGVKYTRPKYVLAGGASVVRNTSLDEGESLRTSFSNDTTFRNQIYAGETNDQKFNYRARVRYNFSDKAFLEVKGSGGLKGSDMGKDYQIDWSNTEELTSVTDRQQRGDRMNDWFSGNLLFKQLFRADKCELRVRAQFTNNHQDNQFVYLDSVFYADGSFNDLGRNDQIRDRIIGNKRQRYSVDYEHGFDNSFRIELGAVLWNRQAERAYDFDSYEEGTGWVTNEGRSNQYLFTETQASAYTQLAGFAPGIESLSYSVGMRAQHTTLNPKPIGTEGDFENRFWSYMPSANLAYEINEGHNLSVNFTSKTNSPGYDRLNPFVTYYSPTSISYGNPYLKPKRVNSWELSHDKSWDGDKMYLSNSLYYKKVNDGDIRYQFEDDEEIINYTYTNIDGAGSLGWEMSANYKPMEQFKIRTSFNLSNSAYVTYRNTQEEVSRRGTNFTSKSSIEYQMDKGFAAQVWMDYFSRQLNTQGQNEAYYSATVVLRQKFLDKKLNVSFMMTDVLNSWERNSSVDQSDTFSSVNTYDRNSQRYYLTVAYYFSKLKWSTDA